MIIPSGYSVPCVAAAFELPHVPAHVLSITLSANSLYVLWPIRTPCPTCTNQNAWAFITPRRPKANSNHTALNTHYLCRGFFGSKTLPESNWWQWRFFRGFWWSSSLFFVLFYRKELNNNSTRPLKTRWLCFMAWTLKAIQHCRASCICASFFVPFAFDCYEIKGVRGLNSPVPARMAINIKKNLTCPTTVQTTIMGGDAMLFINILAD